MNGHPTDSYDEVFRRQFGTFVRRERKRLGFTVQDAANAAGASLKTYVRIERGGRAKDASIEKIDALFGLKPGTALDMVYTGRGLPSSIDDDSQSEVSVTGPDRTANRVDERSQRAVNRAVQAISELTVRDLRHVIAHANENLRVRLSGELDRSRIELERLRASIEHIADNHNPAEGVSENENATVRSHTYVVNVLEERINDLENDLQSIPEDTRLADPRRAYRRELFEGGSHGDYAATS